MKQYKRWISLVLSLIMVLSLLPAQATAAQEKTSALVETAQDSNSVLQALRSDTQSQPTSYGVQDALTKKKNGMPLALANHGAWETVPQNSLLSVYESIVLGADGSAIDVRMTADGVLVLCHDDHIRACTTVAQSTSAALSLVKNLTWEELRTKQLVAPYSSSSQDFAYAITQDQADILNSLPSYQNHYGAEAKAGDKITMARLDDALDLVK